MCVLGLKPKDLSINYLIKNKGEGMGQAKSRGSKEQRIAQAMEINDAPPKVGLYISTKPPGMRLLVEDVTVLDPEDNDGEEGFFLVTMVDEPSAHDMQAMRDELDPDQWQGLVQQYGLVAR